MVTAFAILAMFWYRYIWIFVCIKTLYLSPHPVTHLKIMTNHDECCYHELPKVESRCMHKAGGVCPDGVRFISRVITGEPLILSSRKEERFSIKKRKSDTLYYISDNQLDWGRFISRVITRALSLPLISLSSKEKVLHQGFRGEERKRIHVHCSYIG